MNQTGIFVHLIIQRDTQSSHQLYKSLSLLSPLSPHAHTRHSPPPCNAMLMPHPARNGLALLFQGGEESIYYIKKVLYELLNLVVSIS